ncbi:alpha/beta hydrolase [Acidiferrimicrobium sp. IK]|uniref:alpha/beta fold hydrolase n=1 Tax=Acidiferrimicrobium sp. IK TaxID=2871700 RepID=UPI0021CB9488|nr:alpha/beta hydrolase [Acidiferrimicrobium sp. IK]MCU4182771.1 alpha/beta hydrolase [Acidiferrimicrobium sp. IK]
MSSSTDLFVEIEGSGDPILMVHGLGGTTNFYQPQAVALSAHHRVIRFDLPGAGRSPTRPSVSIESFADDMEAVLERAGVERADIVGHSMGTIAVAHFARTRPERVRRLALLGPVREQPEAAKQATRSRAATVRAEGMIAVADAIVGAATSERTRKERPVVAAFVRELLMGQDPQGYASHCEALAAATAVEIAKIEAPTLLLTGSDDKVGSPDSAKAMFEEFPNASYEVIEGIGHWTALEAPQRVTDALRDFFN